jgi:transposase InsO family protein
VALWEISGRLQTEVAAELGIQPLQLRRWQWHLQGAGNAAGVGVFAADDRAGDTLAGADKASEIARLRRELARTRKHWTTRDEAQRNLFAYIEGYYNRHRIHSDLGYITPC